MQSIIGHNRTRNVSSLAGGNVRTQEQMSPTRFTYDHKFDSERHTNLLARKVSRFIDNTDAGR